MPEIDEEGRILLPDGLLRRLCLKNSCSVPLFETDLPIYFMPSAIWAIFMAVSRDDAREGEGDDEDLTEEEIDRICLEYRHTPKEAKTRIISCPLKDGKMTLPPEVMEKLQVKPGGVASIVKKDGMLFLCGSNLREEELSAAIKAAFITESR